MFSMPHTSTIAEAGAADDLDLLARVHAMQDAVATGFATRSEVVSLAYLIDDIEAEDDADGFDDAEAEAWFGGWAA